MSLEDLIKNVPVKDDRLRVLLLPTEPSVNDLLHAVMGMEGYVCIDAHSEDEVIATIEQSSCVFILIVDNYHLHPKTQAMMRAIQASPDLHPRVRVVGMNIAGWADLIPLDAFLRLPFSVEEMLEVVERMRDDLLPPIMH